MDTWDTPLNNNSLLLDTIVGGITSIATTGGTTVLNAAQAACGTISLTGALGSSAVIAFPAVQGWWSIKNRTTNNNNFGVFAVCGAIANSIGIPPGEITDIQININTVEYRNLGRIGSYLDLAPGTVPPWMSLSTQPFPYLVCNGSSFDPAIYPVLADILGTATLPDFRGRAPYYLNSGTGRLTVAGAGINGDVPFSAGGANGITLAANQIPSLTSVNGAQAISVVSSDTVPKNYLTNTVGTPGSGTPAAFPGGNNLGTLTSSGNNSISVTYTNGSQQIVGNAAPGIVSGIRMIRAG